ncbi:GNAT family N-acetyltransferase [Mycoplasmatota bacterium]|nr:GNAT family N-acetyltransferase [Mycoplasmatota bacterium]
MFVKVTNENLNVMMDYVKKEPAINLFIIGDIEQFGLDVDFQEVYLQYQDNNITGCVLRYYQSVVIYSDIDDFNVDEVMNLINTFQYERISGKKTIIDRITPYLTGNYEVDECCFCQLNETSQLDKPNKPIHSATIEDLDKIIPLLKMVGFYHKSYKQSNSNKIKKQVGRVYYIEQDGIVISSAATSIETSVSAMIGGVCTHLEERKQGLASQVVSKLSFDLLNENKTPCLFYSNPEAGKIYHRLGFKAISNWTMICFETDDI